MEEAVGLALEKWEGLALETDLALLIGLGVLKMSTQITNQNKGEMG
jgi:hypothetical protein